LWKGQDHILSEISPYKSIFIKQRNKTKSIKKLSNIFLLHPSTVRREQSLMPPLILWRGEARIGEILKKT
jgi:hypothetical protein